MEPVESHVWAIIEDALDDYRNGCYSELLDKFESNNNNYDVITDLTGKLLDWSNKKNNLITAISNGIMTDKDAKSRMTQINDQIEALEQEIANAQQVKLNTNQVWQEFWEKLKAVNEIYDYGFTLDLPRKKKIIDAMLDSFTLSQDGKIELKFKLPISETQMKDVCASLIGDGLPRPG